LISKLENCLVYCLLIILAVSESTTLQFLVSRER